MDITSQPPAAAKPSFKVSGGCYVFFLPVLNVLVSTFKGLNSHRALSFSGIGDQMGRPSCGHEYAVHRLPLIDEYKRVVGMSRARTSPLPLGIRIALILSCCQQLSRMHNEKRCFCGIVNSSRVGDVKRLPCNSSRALQQQRHHSSVAFISSPMLCMCLCLLARL